MCWRCVGELAIYLVCECNVPIKHLTWKMFKPQDTKIYVVRSTQIVYPTSTAHTHTQRKLLMSEFGDYNSHTRVFWCAPTIRTTHTRDLKHKDRLNHHNTHTDGRNTKTERVLSERINPGEELFWERLEEVQSSTWMLWVDGEGWIIDVLLLGTAGSTDL